ncbi:hypothetical protein [Bacillus toyonensis]|uniref:hypothetical protein n=1 Tax=Bacillus toyonensis TaxID=155322 RepID=UPI000BF1A9E6|nr:hypothetical protein [Bacillus toyonensis]PEJ85532.1 hypothetical protein CN891_19330 [Bacillus toyonensis]PEL28040.1 hypothetical protein CN623_26710 [Bacillus toyonensis]PGE82856.1 hypothetical protein COM58_00210 [Bacillus toyonensis]
MFYSVFGFILIPFCKVNRHINLIIAVVGIIYISYLGEEIALILPLFILLGLTAGQYRIFENVSKNIWKFRFFTFVTLILSIIGLWMQYKLLPSTIVNNPTEETMDSLNFVKMGITVSPIVSSCYVGILTLVFGCF